jgi:hypothetical protein
MRTTGSQHQRQYPPSSPDRQAWRGSSPAHPPFLGVVAAAGHVAALPEFFLLAAGVLAVVGYAALTARFVVHQLAMTADELAAWAERRRSRRE